LKNQSNDSYTISYFKFFYQYNIKSSVDLLHLLISRVIYRSGEPLKQGRSSGMFLSVWNLEQVLKVH